MKKEQLLALGIAEDIADKVLTMYADDVKELVPKSQLTELTEQLKTANGVITERDKQLTALKKQVGDNEELAGTITALQEANKTQKANYEAQIRSIKINGAVESALTKAGARNIKAARAMLNMDTVSLDEKGEAVGLNEQIEALKADEATGFLFTAQNVQGYVPGQGSDEPAIDTSKMNYEQLCAYMDENPGAEI